MKSMKKILKIIIYIFVAYLLISAIYILPYINFGKEPYAVGPGFSEEENIIRTIMGLPPINSTYKGVPPIYLLSVVIRVVISIILLIANRKKIKTHK